jgi:GNAT superfamily N-acetyltransferase
MIREATLKDLPAIDMLARQFSEASRFVEYRQEPFLLTWANILVSGDGVIFLLDEGAGTLGAMKYPDPNTGELVAVEFFWFVDPAKRGKGIALLKRFEEWAKENKCHKVIMAHLIDSMPEKLGRFYSKCGYRAVEVHYIKEI